MKRRDVRCNYLVHLFGLLLLVVHLFDSGELFSPDSGVRIGDTCSFICNGDARFVRLFEGSGPVSWPLFWALSGPYRHAGTIVNNDYFYEGMGD